MGGNICKRSKEQRMNVRNTQGDHGAQYPKNKKPDVKLGRHVDISPKKTKIAKKHMKRCSTWQITREIQIQTTVRHNHTPTKMAIIKKKPKNTKCWKWSGETVLSYNCRWKRKLLQPVRRTVCRILKKPHTGLPYDSIISWFNICTEKATIQNMNPNIHCSTICNSQYMETSCLSTDGWRRKLWYIYTMEHYTSIKNEIGLPVVTKMNPEYVRVKKVRERNKYCILTRTGGMRKKVFHKGGTWNLEKRYGWTYSQDRITEINGERISGHSGRRRWGKLKKYHWGG